MITFGEKCKRLTKMVFAFKSRQAHFNNTKCFAKNNYEQDLHVFGLTMYTY